MQLLLHWFLLLFSFLNMTLMPKLTNSLEQIITCTVSYLTRFLKLKGHYISLLYIPVFFQVMFFISITHILETLSARVIEHSRKLRSIQQ